MTKLEHMFDVFNCLFWNSLQCIYITLHHKKKVNSKDI